MNGYKRHTLRDLIAELRSLPKGSRVKGMDATVSSYRGYYERNAIAPATGGIIDAHHLAGLLEKQDGNAIYGYKGGDYQVSLDELVYLAHDGDVGPSIIGLAVGAAGFYEPVLLENDCHF